MEGRSNGKAICSGPHEEEGSPMNKPLSVMAPPKLSLGGNSSSISSAASGGAAIDNSTAKTGQHQAPQRHCGANYDPNLDPKKLRRIMSNRLSAQRSRMKKLQYLAGLERQAKGFEAQIAELQPQLISFQNEKQRLMLEQQALDLQMAALEKETLLRDAQIEKNKTEVTMLRELHMMQEEQLYDWDTGLQPMPTDLQPMSYDPIPNYYPNSDQAAQNGDGTSYMNMDMPQNMDMLAVPDENQANMTQPEMDEMETNRINNNAWNPNHGHGRGFN